MSIISLNFISRRRQAGAVLPVALILLVVLTFAGLSAAKRSTTHDVIAQNLRVNEVAQQSAESALRYCEAVVMDLVDNAGTSSQTLRVSARSKSPPLNPPMRFGCSQPTGLQRA